jgi:hypothetical protein
MSDSRGRRALAPFWCVVVLFLGCHRAPDQATTSPGEATKPEPGPGARPVAEQPPQKDPAVEPPRTDVDPGQSISLVHLLGSEGNVHLYFLQRRPAAEEKPFFVVWTDARGYSGTRGYPSAQNIPPRKNLVEGDLTLRYGGKDNDYDREVKCSFAITLGEKGQFQLGGKTYDFEKGALFLIAGKDAEVCVKQLSRDPSRLPVDRASVVAVAKADPDIKEFLSTTAKPK